MGKRLFVAAFAGKRVIDIRNGDDLRRYRDFVALESVRVSSSVIAFVVPTANFVGVLHQRFVLAERHGIEHQGTIEGVSLHDIEFFGSELARLVQVKKLLEDVQKAVYDRSGILLEPEIKIL